MTLACPIRSEAEAGLQSARSVKKAAVLRVAMFRMPSPNPVWPVQEILTVAERGLGILIDRDNDRLHMGIAVTLQSRLASHISKRLDPRRMIRLVVVPF